MRITRSTPVLFASVLTAVFSASLHAQIVTVAHPEPYTATFKTTIVQKLANGVTITREGTSKTAIDSSGRNYQENQILMNMPGMPDMTNVIINDPVNHTITSWNSRSTVANVFHQPDPDTQPHPQTTHIPPPLQPSPTPQKHPANPAPQVDDLGTRTILGLTATGRRTTLTIPAGSEGNDLPFTITTETWRAADPPIVLLDIHDDPRTGTTTREATDFERGEPDPSLFQIPDGYTVKDTYTNQQN
jgi:hypothetical protein